MESPHPVVWVGSAQGGRGQRELLQPQATARAGKTGPVGLCGPLQQPPGPRLSVGDAERDTIGFLNPVPGGGG